MVWNKVLIVMLIGQLHWEYIFYENSKHFGFWIFDSDKSNYYISCFIFLWKLCHGVCSKVLKIILIGQLHRVYLYKNFNYCGFRVFQVSVEWNVSDKSKYGTLCLISDKNCAMVCSKVQSYIIWSVIVRVYFYTDSNHSGFWIIQVSMDGIINGKSN